MNQMTVAHLAPTMTSREMADLTEKRHDSVKRTIDMLARTGVIGDPHHVEYLDALNRPAVEYAIGKRDSYIVVAQLSPEFTARIVDRWQELEAKQVPELALPQTFAQALRLAAEQADLIEQQAAQLVAAAPALQFVDKYVDSTGTKGFRQVCKLLKVKEPEFREFLSDAKIMYKLGGEWVPYSEHIDAGRFVVRAGTAETSGHSYNSSRFTAKGITWVAGEFAKYQIRGHK